MARKRVLGDAKPEVGIAGTAQASDPASSIVAVVNELRNLQAMRVSLIRDMIRSRNSTDALARILLGYPRNLSAEDRKRMPKGDVERHDGKRKEVVKRAREWVEGIEAKYETAKKEGRELLLGSFDEQVIAYRMVRILREEQRKRLEKRMVELAKSLPVYPWVESVKGFGALGLAIIVGEAGDLANYRHPDTGEVDRQRLWKRLGVACIEGKRQRKIANDPELAKEMGYNARRRSALWTVVDSMLRADGAYRTVYLNRREREMDRHPEFVKGWDEAKKRRRISKHGDERARRFAGKIMVMMLQWNWERASDGRPFIDYTGPYAKPIQRGSEDEREAVDVAAE